MHEHGLADHILDSALRHPNRPREALPRVITVLVCELSGLSQDALQANLDHVCEHQGLQPIELRVETVPLLGRCPACDATSVVDEDLQCPACGAARVQLCGGETVIIESCQYAPSDGTAVPAGASEGCISGHKHT